MNVKSLKSSLALSVCIWGVTGASAFWAGRHFGAQSVGVVDSKTGKVSAKLANGFYVDGKLMGTSANSKDPGAPTMDMLLNGKGKLDPLGLARWASTLSAKDCADLMKSLQAMPAGAKRDALLGAVLDSWAKQDPNAYLKNLDKMTNPRAKEAGIATALQALATQDPKAALDWLKQNPGPTSALNTAQMNAIIAGYAANNPNDAFNYVNTLPDGAGPNSPEAQAKLAAFQALISGMGDQGNFADAAAMLANLPAGAMNTRGIYTSMVDQWAQSSPVDAAAWVATLNNPRQQAQYDSQIAMDWATTDPAAAAQWAAQTDAALLAANANNTAAAGGRRGGAGGLGGGPGGGGNLLSSAVSTWVQSGDIDGAGQFLNQMPASPDKDQAVVSFIAGASYADPAGAMSWVATITNPGLQNRAATQVAVQWASTDPAGFNQYLSTLPANQQATLQQSVQYAANGGGGPGGAGGGRRGAGAGGNFGGGAVAGNTGPVITGGNAAPVAGGRAGGRRGGGGGGGGG